MSKAEERHLETDLDKIREDHLARYYKARDIVFGNVIDAACGCGYGTYMISHNETVTKVTGVDIDETTIEFAERYWKSPATRYVSKDLTKFHPGEDVDWLVSFETIEHIKTPEVFIKNIGAKNILCSVPNEDVFKFNPRRHIFHVKHYTVKELETLLTKCGYRITNMYYQEHKNSKDFTKVPGRTLIMEGIKE